MGTLQIDWTTPIGTTTYPGGPGAIALHPTEPVLYLASSVAQDSPCPQAVLLKANFHGDILWQQVLSTPHGSVATQVAIAPDGLVYGVGIMANQSESPMSDIWLACYQPDGTQQWLKKLRSIHPQHPDSCAIDAQGFIYITGHTVPSESEGEGWLERFAPDGESLWRTTLGPYTTPHPLQLWMGIDPSARTKFARIAVYVTGSTRIPIAGSEEGEYTWLARYSSEGIQRWITALGKAPAIAVQMLRTEDATDHLYIVGRAEPGGAIAPGLFLAQYNWQGEQQALTTLNLDAQLGLVGGEMTATGIALLGIHASEGTLWQALSGFDGSLQGEVQTGAVTEIGACFKGAIARSGEGFLLGQVAEPSDNGAIVEPADPEPTIQRQWFTKVTQG